MLPAMDLYYGKQLRSFFPYLCRHFHTPPWAVLESPGTTAAMWRIYHQVPGRPRCLLAFPLSGIRAVRDRIPDSLPIVQGVVRDVTHLMRQRIDTFPTRAELILMLLDRSRAAITHRL